MMLLRNGRLCLLLECLEVIIIITAKNSKYHAGNLQLFSQRGSLLSEEVHLCLPRAHNHLSSTRTHLDLIYIRHSPVVSCTQGSSTVKLWVNYKNWTTSLPIWIFSPIFPQWTFKVLQQKKPMGPKTINKCF